MLALLLLRSLYYPIGLKGVVPPPTGMCVNRTVAGGFVFEASEPETARHQPHVPWEHEDKRYHPLYGTRTVERGQVGVTCGLLSSAETTEGYLPGTAVVRLPGDKTLVTHTRPLGRDRTEVFWALYTKIPYSPIAELVHGRIIDMLLNDGDVFMTPSARKYRAAYLAALLGQDGPS